MTAATRMVSRFILDTFGIGLCVDAVFSYEVWRPYLWVTCAHTFFE